MAEVIELGPHTKMTVKECLAFAKRESDEYRDVIVLAYNHEGELVVRSSQMSCADSLWLLMDAVDYVRNP